MFLTFLSATACASAPLAVSISNPPATATEAAKSVGVFEQQLENAAAARDVSFLEHAFAPSLLFTHAGGTHQDRAALLAAFRAPARSGNRTLSRTVDEPSRHIEIHGNIAVTRGKIVVRRLSDGRENQYIVQYVRVYRRDVGGWKILSHNTVGEIKPQG